MDDLSLKCSYKLPSQKSTMTPWVNEFEEKLKLSFRLKNLKTTFSCSHNEI